jgi:hypothetical protein
MNDENQGHRTPSKRSEQVGTVTESLDLTKPGGDELTPKSTRRNWPVLILGLLLLIQGIISFFIGGLYAVIIEFDWEITAEDFLINIPLGLRGGVYIAIGILAVLAAIGFFRLWPGAWLNAVMVQGTSLLIALFLYFHERPFYIYIIMVFNIFIVIYLNYSEVKEAFHSRPLENEWNELDEH